MIYICHSLFIFSKSVNLWGQKRLPDFDIMPYEMFAIIVLSDLNISTISSKLILLIGSQLLIVVGNVLARFCNGMA